MTRLAAVQSGLHRVRRFRWLIRNTSALAFLGSVMVWGLAAVFLLDLGLQMDRLSRSICLVALLGLAAWAVRRYLWPALRLREDDLSLALLVEKNQGLSSDLVAALQFADGSRPQYGSAVLREAVVDCAVEVAPSINFLEGFSRRHWHRRLTVFGVSAAVFAVLMLSSPARAAAFFNRLLLGNAHYPTRTLIAEVLSPGAHAAYGQPIAFSVRVAGVRPNRGRVDLRTLTHGLTTTVDLLPEKNRPDVFTGRLERALDDMSFTLRLGDAYLDPRTIKLVPLPAVTLDMQVHTPAYAKDLFQPVEESVRQMAVLEGSQVVPIITADKPLASASIFLDGKTYPMRRDGTRFVLDGSNSPLKRVLQSLRFEAQVVDADGLSLEQPLLAALTVRPDNPPRVAIAAVSRLVLPTAAPRLYYEATDDFGLREIKLHAGVIHGEGQPIEATGAAAAASPPEAEITLPVLDLPQHPRNSGRRHVDLPLEGLNLNKGDRVTVCLEAVDYRGDQPGLSTRSESVSFEVGDREAVLKAMEESDDLLGRKLDQIIRAQLGAKLGTGVQP